MPDAHLDKFQRTVPNVTIITMEFIHSMEQSLFNLNKNGLQLLDALQVKYQRTEVLATIITMEFIHLTVLLPYRLMSNGHP